jgi:hypothetical protein
MPKWYGLQGLIIIIITNALLPLHYATDQLYAVLSSDTWSSIAQIPALQCHQSDALEPPVTISSSTWP